MTDLVQRLQSEQSPLCLEAVDVSMISRLRRTDR